MITTPSRLVAPPKPLVVVAALARRPSSPLQSRDARARPRVPSWARTTPHRFYACVKASAGWVATANQPRANRRGPLPRPNARSRSSCLGALRAGGVADGNTCCFRLPDLNRSTTHPLRIESSAAAVRPECRLPAWKCRAPPIHEHAAASRPNRSIAGSFTAMFDRVLTRLIAVLLVGTDRRACATRATVPRACPARRRADLEQDRRNCRGAADDQPVVPSIGACGVSVHPLASESGRLAFERGGKFRRMIAVSFAFGSSHRKRRHCVTERRFAISRHDEATTIE